jgi:hypothetical protein
MALGWVLHLEAPRARVAGHQTRDGLELVPLSRVPLTVLDRDRATLEVSAKTVLPARGELIAPAGAAARLTTPEGIRVEIAGKSRVDLGRLAETGQSKLRLMSGSVACRVPPLGSDRQFSIVTRDAEVVVHGTEFSVDVGDAAAKGTCVRVREGLVAVHHARGKELLGAGASWGCTPREATLPEASALLPVKPASRGAPRVSRQKAATELRGTLADETRLLSAGLAAERRGQPGEARDLYSILLERYPASTLAPDARAGLTRLR